MKKKNKFTFIDLFAGIGGFHLALHDIGGKCVFVNEFDNHARKTYEYNFREQNKELFLDELREPYFWKSIKDITLSGTNQPKSVWFRKIRRIIPSFDVLCAGFPCQPFSRIGKKNGFEDDRGTLFNDIHRVILARRPKVVFLENVRNILNYDEGRTFRFILKKLESAGYHVNEKQNDSWSILNASDFGLPAARSRFYLVTFRKDIGCSDKFKFPKSITPGGITLRRFFRNKKWPNKIGRTIRVGGRGSPVYKKGNGEWFIDRRNWDTYIVGDSKHVLTPYEAKKMMGFPSYFKFPSELSDSQAMKQIGNSVAVPVIKAIADNIIKTIYGRSDIA